MEQNIENREPRQNEKNHNRIEIDIFDVIKKILDDKKLLIRIVIVFALVGGIIAFTTPPEYQVSATMMPELNQSSGGSSISSIFNSFGMQSLFNLGQFGQSSALRADLYPMIVQSTTFLNYLSAQKVNIQKEDTLISLTDYYHTMRPKSLVFRIKSGISGLPYIFKKSDPGLDDEPHKESDSTVEYSWDEIAVMMYLKERVEVALDNKTGIVSVNVKFSDPVAAAQICELTIAHLTQYITDYYIDKSKNDLEFVQKRYVEAKDSFERVQKQLATFRDENRNIITQLAQTREQELESKYNLAYEIYRSFAQELEQAKLAVQRKTPVFKELEPVIIPLYRSAPRRLFIIIVFTILGICCGLGWLLFKVILKRFRRELSAT